MATHDYVSTIYLGGSALSDFRAAALLRRVQEVAPGVEAISARYVHWVASDAPLPVDALRDGLLHHPKGWQLLTGADADAWARASGQPLVLTDDYAPVDQILTEQTAS